MGLFSKKPPCPICGGKISWLLPTKIEGEYICDTCADKIDMPDERRAELTMGGLEQYLVFYEENQRLKERFQVTDKLDFGCLDTKIIFDVSNRLFCMSGKPDKTIFQGAQLKSFTIKEDGAPLFTGTDKGLVRHNSTVPERLAAMAPQIQMFMMTKRMNESMERRDDDDEYRYQPRMDIPEPFQQFCVELQLDHPYWSVLTCDMDGPTFSNDSPNIEHYLYEYQENVQLMERLANLLMQVAFPGRGEISPQAAAASTPAGGGADEILKFKGLLDAGVITQAEFDAKKRQLLGL